MAWAIAWNYVIAARKFDDFGARIMAHLKKEGFFEGEETK
jgi:hypothetical protein